MDLKGLGLLGAVAAACFAIAGGTARADFTPGCGQGFSLTYDPVTEQVLANDNGKCEWRWFCLYPEQCVAARTFQRRREQRPQGFEKLEEQLPPEAIAV